jgi:hypothetical protein
MAVIRKQRILLELCCKWSLWFAAAYVYSFRKVLKVLSNCWKAVTFEIH